MQRLRLKPDDPDAVREKLAELSRAAQFEIGLRSLSENCRRFLHQVQRGYKFSLEEYFNDYEHRDLLLEIADEAPDDLAARIREWVAEWDAAFEATTQPVPNTAVTLSDRDQTPLRVPLKILPELQDGLDAWEIVV